MMIALLKVFAFVRGAQSLSHRSRPRLACHSKNGRRQISELNRGKPLVSDTFSGVVSLTRTPSISDSESGDTWHGVAIVGRIRQHLGKGRDLHVILDASAKIDPSRAHVDLSKSFSPPSQLLCPPQFSSPPPQYLLHPLHSSVNKLKKWHQSPNLPRLPAEWLLAEPSPQHRVSFIDQLVTQSSSNQPNYRCISSPELHLRSPRCSSSQWSSLQQHCPHRHHPQPRTQRDAIPWNRR
jgi:hypothetical protein